MTKRNVEIEKSIMDTSTREKVYKSYFESMIVDGLAKLARELLGLEAGFTLVARVAEKGAYESFKIVMNGAQQRGLDLSSYSLKDILEALIERLGMGLTGFERIIEEEDKYIIEAKKCPYYGKAEGNPVACGVCVGLVAGMLRRYGLNVRWVKSPAKKKELCLSSTRPEYIVYRDPEAKPPYCRVIVERLKC